MSRKRSYFVIGFAAGLLAAMSPSLNPQARAENAVAPAYQFHLGRTRAPNLNPYTVQEDPIIDGPSSFWLIPASGSQPSTPVIWCSTADEWAEILKADGMYVPTLTRKEIRSYLFGEHGWPVHLVVKFRSGSIGTVECFGGPD